MANEWTFKVEQIHLHNTLKHYLSQAYIMNRLNEKLASGLTFCSNLEWMNTIIEPFS